MQGNVGVGAFHPAIVPRRDVEQIAGPEREYGAVVHGHSAAPGHHEPDVFDLTGPGARAGSHVRGPLPPRLVARPPHGHAAERHELERPLLESPRLVGAVEPPDGHRLHVRTPHRFGSSSARASPAAVRPATVSILRRPVAPLAMRTAARATPARSATNRISSAFA